MLVRRPRFPRPRPQHHRCGVLYWLSDRRSFRDYAARLENPARRDARARREPTFASPLGASAARRERASRLLDGAMGNALWREPDLARAREGLLPLHSALPGASPGRRDALRRAGARVVRRGRYRRAAAQQLPYEHRGDGKRETSRQVVGTRILASFSRARRREAFRRQHVMGWRREKVLRSRARLREEGAKGRSRLEAYEVL